MIILQDSQIKKIFHNGDEVKKILDWDGNVIFYKQSGGGGMTNDIKFTTSPSVASSNVFTVTYTDSTKDTLSYSEPSKEYSLSIPTDKIVKKIDFDNTMVDEVSVSCKINLSETFFTNKPKTIRILNCDATSSTSLASLFFFSTNVETISMKDLDVSNVTDMSNMFYFSSNATTIDIANWNTSSVTDLSNAFYYCSKVTSLDVSSFNTSNVTYMVSMFDGCSGLTSLDVSNFNTSNVTNMSGMFGGCESLTSLDLRNFNTSNVTNMSQMFNYCRNLTSLDLSGWDMTNVTNINYMFEGCTKLSTIRMVGCNQTTIDKIKDALTDAGILNQVTIITGDVPTTKYIKFTTSPSVASENNVQVTYADSTQDTVSYSEPSKEYSLSIPTDKVVNKIDFDNTMVDEVKVSCKVNLSETFFTNKPKTIRILNCDATSSKSLAKLFSGSTSTEIEMKDLDVSNATDMSYMFYRCSSTNTIDIANWNTSSVTNLANAFNSCYNVTTLDLSSWNTSNVTNMRYMFNMNTRGYAEFSKLTSLNLSGWDTSNVTDMTSMFKGCIGFTSLDLSHFNTSKVTNMSKMFSFYDKIFQDLENFSNLTSLDLSGWDMTNVTNINDMFKGCTKLSTIRMVGCNQTTIDKIKSALTSAGILNNVTIVTE